MRTLSQDPRYVSLARRAAGKLGTSATPIVNAILAQWQCEIGANDAYPPTRNNPGNLAAGAAQSVGARYTIAPGSNPQPGNPIVTFPSPEAGADAYGKLLATLGRYAPVRSAVIARDGRAYLQAINASGYGGSLSCTLSVYGGSAIPGAGGSFGGSGLPTSSGPAGMLVSAPAGQTLADEFPTVNPTAPFTQAMLNLMTGDIPMDNPDRDQLVATYRSFLGRPLNTIPRQPHTYYSPGGGLLGIDPGALAGSLFGGFAWVPGVAANLAVLAGIGVLAYVGLRNLADGLGAS